MGYRWYYSALSKEQRQVYEDLRRGIGAMAPSVRTLRLDTRTLSDILFCLRLDEPRLAFVKTASFRAVREAEHVEVIPQYAFDGAKMRTHLQTIETRVKKITAPVRGKSEEERLRYVHDWLLDNVRYDKLYKNYAHEVLGPLCHGVGVCEGIAKTAKMLLDELGMESLVVIGQENAEKHGIEGMRHAWNIVRLGGHTYHMDATFDLTLSRCGVKRYDYYKLSDSEIFADHRVPVWQVPACQRADQEYYRREKLTADSPESLEKLLARLGKKRGSVFVFRWEGGSMPLDEIARVCSAYAASRGKAARLSHNPARQVVLMTLKDADDGGKEMSVDELPD